MVIVKRDDVKKSMASLLLTQFSGVPTDDASLRPWRWALAPLVPLSHLYGFGMLARKRLYSVGLLKERSLPVKVISIGNLTLGGTGKTPVVIALANELHDSGHAVGVVSRGYGRQPTEDVVEVSDGHSRKSDPRQTGDEPFLIAERCLGVPVAVGADRYAAGQYLLGRFSLDTLILDDGFQHHALKRDVDVVLVDATAPFGNGYLFPRGRLRERLSALERASLVVVTRAGQGEFHGVFEAIHHIAPAARLCATDFVPTGLRRIDGSRSQPPDALKGERVVAFSGIGNPESFRRLLERLGALVVDHCLFPDHHVYCIRDMRRVVQLAATLRADRVVTTEKDAVKIRLLTHGDDDPGVWALRIDLEWLAGGEEWKRLVLQS
jgi:tetraacyldisaccharide 4'-kinase